MTAYDDDTADVKSTVKNGLLNKYTKKYDKKLLSLILLSRRDIRDMNIGVYLYLFITYRALTTVRT